MPEEQWMGIEIGGRFRPQKWERGAVRKGKYCRGDGHPVALRPASRRRRKRSQKKI